MIDRDHLARQTAQDPVLQRDILVLFVDQMQDLDRLLRAGVDQASTESVLHRYRGAAAAVGATALVQELARTEASGAASTTGVDRLRAVLRQTVADARRFIAALPRPGLAKDRESH